MTTLEAPLTKTTPFAHQARIIEETKNARYHGLFMEQGTGKTHVTIATFTHLHYAGLIDGVLILAPNGVHDNWHRNEIPLHCQLENETEMIMACWHASDGIRRRQYWDYVANLKYDFEGDEHRLVILMANIEAVRTESFRKSIGHFVQHRRFLLVIDESTTIKNPKAEQTQVVLKLARFAAYSRILTGTPITQSPTDLWSQCRALDENALPYSSYTAFKHMFALEQGLHFGHRSFNKVIGYQNQDILAKLLAPFTTRILKSDCLDLPPKLYQTRYVELTPEQKALYKSLVMKSLATVAPGTVTVTAVITLMLRLHQITLGYVTADDGTTCQIPHHRIDRLRDLIEENPSKAIIFVRFLEDICQITAALRDQQKSYICYSGEVSAPDRNRAIDLFQTGDCQYFVATSAAARGLTLHAAEQVIYYSQGFSLETRLQSEDRAHRIGQTTSVLYTDLVAQGSIDEKVVAALKAKKELANSVLNKTQLEALLALEE